MKIKKLYYSNLNLWICRGQANELDFFQSSPDFRYFVPVSPDTIKMVKISPKLQNVGIQSTSTRLPFTTEHNMKSLCQNAQNLLERLCMPVQDQENIIIRKKHDCVSSCMEGKKNRSRRAFKKTDSTSSDGAVLSGGKAICLSALLREVTTFVSQVTNTFQVVKSELTIILDSSLIFKDFILVTEADIEK